MRLESPGRRISIAFYTRFFGNLAVDGTVTSKNSAILSKSVLYCTGAEQQKAPCPAMQ